MKVEKEILEKSQVKLTIELTMDEFIPYIEKASRRISERVDVPGFRKGQAPLEVVKQKVGEMTVLQEAAELAVQKSLPEAIKQEELDTVGQPEIGLEKLAPENNLVFTAILPLMPEIELADIATIKAEKEKTDVTEEELNKVVDNILKMRAKEVLVDRAAKMGDKVEIKFNVFLNKVPVDGGQNDKYPLPLGEGSMIPGFEEKVVGMKKGEEKEFELKFPAEYHNKQLAGKIAEFKVGVNDVFEVTLPELNDGLAKELGSDSVNELKDSIEKNLFEEKNQKVDGKFEADVIEAMIKYSKFGDIPEAMVNREAHTMMHELEQNVGNQGIPFEEYLKHLKKDRKQLMLDFTPDAVKRIKSALIIRELAKKENIEATDEERKEELDRLTHAYQGNEKVLQELTSPGYQEYITNVVRNRKTLHWIVAQVEANK